MAFHLKQFLRSIRYALKGLRYAYKNEQNFRLQILAALLVVLLMLIVGVSEQQAIVLIAVITAVLVLELLNTTLEKFIDVVKPRLHYLVEAIKDLMAAAVFLTSLAAIIIGLLIFVPYFIHSS